MHSVDENSTRALDIAVAERVMGFRWFHCAAGTGVERNQFCTQEQAEIWRELGWSLTEIPSPPPDQFNDDSAALRYSTNIQAAMSVVEELRGRGLDVAMESAWKTWEVIVWNNEKPIGKAEYATLPESICRAALKATECLSISDIPADGQASLNSTRKD